MNSRFFFSTSILLTLTIAGTAQAQVFAPQLTLNASSGTLSESKISNGPWTLSNSGGGITANNQTPNYCTGSSETPNTSSNPLQPYYSPFVYTSPLGGIPTSTTNNSLQAYFDYRVQGTNEAIVAASSTDGGVTWTSSQKLLELNPNLCSINSSGTNNASSLSGASDVGQGNPYALTINGKTFLYTLDRSAGNVATALVVNTISPQSTSANPPNPSTTTSVANKIQRASGLNSPSGIIGDDGNYPRNILYVQKQAGTNSGTCGNSDTTTVRVARTTDGINFKDLGPVIGLNDSTTTSSTLTRYIGSRGTLFKLPQGGGYGLIFTGGICSDTDSEGYHYIGYAESQNLSNGWSIINGIGVTAGNAAFGPIASTYSTDPADTPLISSPSGVYSWTNGRLNAPNLVASKYNSNTYTFNLIFSGSNTTSPSTNYSSYRTIYQYPLSGSFTLNQ